MQNSVRTTFRSQAARSSCPSFLAATLLAAFALTAGHARAAPVTMYFTYDTLSVQTISGTSTTPATYSGWITWDLSRAESSGRTVEDGTERIYALSDSGCAKVVNGVCRPERDYGSGTPVVTDYSVTTPFGTLRPMSPSDAWDTSQRTNSRGTVNEEFFVARGQGIDRVTVTPIDDPNYRYTELEVWRVLSLGPMAVTGNLFSDFTNLDAPISLAMVSATQDNVYIEDRRQAGNCTTPYPFCPLTLDPAWFSIRGSLRYLGLAPPVPSQLGFTTASVTVSESGGRALLTVARTGSTDGRVSATWAVSAGTATAGADYSLDPEGNYTLDWADRESNTKTISIPIFNDTTKEALETFTVTLSSPSSGATLSTAQATATIADDDRSGGGGGGGGGAIPPLSVLGLLLLAVRRLDSDY